MKDERTKKMRQKRIEKKTASFQTPSVQSSAEKPTSEITTTPGQDRTLSLFSPDEINKFAPKIVMKDGKLVIEEATIIPFYVERQNLILVQGNKPKKLTSMSYRTKDRTHTEKWTPEETRKFFKAIEIFGSDFSMIAKLFPTRTRNQVKNKFRKEEKESSEKIEQSFRKHKLSGKKSLKDKIKNFSTTLLRGDSKNYTLPKTDNDIADFARNTSNSSIDSMDAVRNKFFLIQLENFR